MFDGPDGQIQNNNINILLNKGNYNINSNYLIKCIFFVIVNRGRLEETGRKGFLPLSSVSKHIDVNFVKL